MGETEPNKWQRWDPRHNFEVPVIDTQMFPIAEPVPEMDMQWTSRRWTVCQILRELFHSIDDPALKLKCRIACRMTKAMATEITKHNPEWGRGTWPWREKRS